MYHVSRYKVFGKCCPLPAHALCCTPSGRSTRSLSWGSARLTRPLGLTSLRSASLRASCLGAGFAQFGGLRSIPPLPCLSAPPARFLSGSHRQPFWSPLSAPRSSVALVGSFGASIDVSLTFYGLIFISPGRGTLQPLPSFF